MNDFSDIRPLMKWDGWVPLPPSPIFKWRGIKIEIIMTDLNDPSLIAV